MSYIYEVTTRLAVYEVSVGGPTGGVRVRVAEDRSGIGKELAAVFERRFSGPFSTGEGYNPDRARWVADEIAKDTAGAVRQVGRVDDGDPAGVVY